MEDKQRQIREINGHKEAIKLDRGLLETVFSSMNEAIVILDINGDIVDFNEAFAHLCRFKNKEETLKSIDSFATIIKAYHLDGSLLPIEEWAAVKALNGESGANFEYIIERTDINERWAVSTNYTPLRNDKGEITGAVQTLQDITEHKKAEEALRESEEQYSELFNSMSEMFQVLELVYDEKGRAVDFYYRDVNPATEKLVNMSRDQIVGKRAKELFGKVEDYWIKALSQVNETKEPMHINNYSAELDKYYDVNAFKLEGQNKVAIIFTDITEQKKAEEELDEARYVAENESIRLQTILEALPVGVMITDVTGKAILLNDALNDMWRGSRTLKSLDDYPEYKAWDVKTGMQVQPEDWPVSEAIDSGEPQLGVEFDFQRFDDTKGTMLISAVPIKDKKNKITGGIAIAQEITKRKKAEEELRESHDNLEEQVEERAAEIGEAYQNLKEEETKLRSTIIELEHSNKELQNFAYITSHDLQEPLRSVVSYAQLIERRYKGRLDSDADEFIDFMVSGAIQMKSMIQGLLDYSLINKYEIEFVKTDMGDMVEKAVSNLQYAIDESNAEITHGFLPTVMADPDQMVDVFQNLIDNAIKFKKPNEPPKIHISVGTDKERYEWVFSVSDNGIGMEKQYFDHIFEVFKRLHPIGEYEGIGIGLSIVKGIIERHGGRIWVESTFGMGSTFYFTIPMKNK